MIVANNKIVKLTVYFVLVLALVVLGLILGVYILKNVDTDEKTTGRFGLDDVLSFETRKSEQLIEKVVPPTGRTHSATVIVFHGSGDTGNNFIEWIRFLLGKDMEFSHIKVIFPTAPVQPYTPAGGENSNVWFDRRDINITAQECRKSMASMYETVTEMLKREMGQGIPAERIIVGGFSMGGALALHTAFHLQTNLAGVFACSSFLNHGSVVYESLGARQTDQELPELLMFHGDRDTMVPLAWGKHSFDELQKLGVKGEFVPLKNTMHEIKKREFVQLSEWIEKKLPPLDKDLANKL